MLLQTNISLRQYNTFGINVPAENLVVIEQIEQIFAIAELNLAKHVLGGGSNILFTKPVSGITLLNRLKGIQLIKEDAKNVWFEVASGEIWHDFVMYAVDKGYGGIENLALIPGTVGAAPIQNIGAYGVEVKDTIESVNCFSWADQSFFTLSAIGCKFQYRDSIFKGELKDKVFITSVIFKLSKKPQLNVSYGGLQAELSKTNFAELSVRDVAHAVINIRKSKLPDPRELGNAGSFFKNPTILMSHFNLLKGKFSAIPSYPVDSSHTKIPAGWLIEQCGLKGFRMGDAGVHQLQALVLVNYGTASGSEIFKLSEKIIIMVQEKFGIELEREVGVW